MHKQAVRSLMILVLAIVPLAAMADAPHYSFGQIQYGWIEDGSVDGNTYGVGVLFGGEIFQVGTAYNRLEYDLQVTDITVNEWTLAGGLHGLLGETADLVGNIGYFDLGGDADENGWFLDGGVRWMVVPALELNGFITHYEPSDSDSDQVLSLSAIAMVKTFGIGISWATANDADSEQWRVFLRFNFGEH